MQMYMVILRQFSYNGALFGLVIHHDPWLNNPLIRSVISCEGVALGEVTLF